jgi:hypothetical protein
MMGKSTAAIQKRRGEFYKKKENSSPLLKVSAMLQKTTPPLPDTFEVHFAACAVFVSPPAGKSGRVIQKKKVDPKSDTVVIVKKAPALRAAVCFD